MSNLVLPTFSWRNIGIEFDREMTGNVSTLRAESGVSERYGWWPYPHYKYTIDYAILRSDAINQEWQQIVGLFAQVGTSGDTFLMQDPDDYTVTGMPFGIGDGSTRTFQLQRSLIPSASLPAAGSRHYWPQQDHGYEPIFDLVSQPTLYKAGVSTTAFTYGQYQSGIVTFTTAPANGAVLTWDGQFYRRVKFATDKLVTRRTLNQWYEAKSVELVSEVQ